LWLNTKIRTKFVQLSRSTPPARRSRGFGRDGSSGGQEYRRETLFRTRRLAQLAECTFVIRSVGRAGSFVPLYEIDQPAPEVLRFRERLIGPEKRLEASNSPTLTAH